MAVLMTSPSKWLGFLGLAFCLASCTSGECIRRLPTDERATAIHDEYVEGGYTVQTGAVRPFRISDCDMLPSCFGNNASSPYGLWYLPPAPGAASSPARVDDLPPDAEGRTAGWQLREDEAVVFVGRTAPAAAYFSFAPYLMARADGMGVLQTVFASLADATNQTAFDGDPFDRDIAVIVSADENLADDLYRSMRATGLDSDEIVVMSLAAEQLRLGTDTDDDIVLMLQRFALFEDPAAGEAFLDDMPAHVMRITPPEPAAISAFPIATRQPRATGMSEDGLTAALDALDAAIRADYAGQTLTDVTVLPAATIGVVLRPDYCIENLENCLGEVSDTVYSAGPINRGAMQFGDPVFLGNTPGERIVAFGVNHEAFGRATYSNAVVMNSGRLAGVAAFDSRQMPGSAEVFVPGSPDAHMLFAVSFMRDCGMESFCVEVPTGFPGVDYGEELSFVFRAYLQPGASVSPQATELLTERAIHIVP